jgi:hypothetical protein
MNSARLPLLLLAVLVAMVVSSRAAPKPLLVHYQPWFVAKPYSGSWGWHWTMDHFNPEHIDASGQPQIASWYRPLIGPYDSADPVVLEYHVLLMKLAGIDGLIVDWYGPDNFLDYAVNNERTLAVFKQARQAGLSFVLCYEDQTVRQQIDGGYFPAAESLAHARDTMRYAQSNYFTDPAYLRRNGQPVLLNFGPQFFKENAEWEQIFSVLEVTNRPAFYTEDTRLPVAEGAFNWPPMWMSLAPGARGVLSAAALKDYLDRFEQNGRGWPSYISSAFPRFHDIYEPAGVRDYWGYLGDRRGQTLRQTLTRALTNSSSMVQIVTWNDFAEGTMVEPTVEYGLRDLGIIQECRRRYLDPEFPVRTNHLEIPLRLYHLRRNAATNAPLNARLDEVVAAILDGDLEQAQQQLKAVESPKEVRTLRSR